MMKKQKYSQSTGIRTLKVQGTRTEVRGDDDESFRRALKIFSKKVADADILGELRKREYYEKPSQARKRRKDQARKREMRRIQESKKPTF